MAKTRHQTLRAVEETGLFYTVVLFVSIEHADDMVAAALLDEKNTPTFLEEGNSHNPNLKIR